MADGGEAPWGDNPPFHAPVFVVTHRPRATLLRHGGTSFTYVIDGIGSAVEQARAAANGKNVALAGGGTLVRQALKAGLVDELELHIAPAVLGAGMRLLDADVDLKTKEAIELTPTKVVNCHAIWPNLTTLIGTVSGMRTPDQATEWAHIRRSGGCRALLVQWPCGHLAWSN